MAASDYPPPAWAMAVWEELEPLGPVAPVLALERVEAVVLVFRLESNAPNPWWPIHCQPPGLSMS